MTAQRNCASSSYLISLQRALKQTERLQVCEELRHLQFFLPAARRRDTTAVQHYGPAGNCPFKGYPKIEKQLRTAVVQMRLY